MKNINESYFVMGEDKYHTQLIKERFADSWSDSYSSRIGHIVYIDTEPKQIIIASVQSDINRNANNPSFAECLKWVNLTNFWSILKLTTTYPHCLKILTSSPNVIRSKNPLLDIFLKETNGWLVYNYQLEGLMCMGTGCSPQVAQAFRKNICKRKVPSLDDAGDIKVFDTRLKDIIMERSNSSITYNPEYRGAYLLYRYVVDCSNF